MGQGVHSKKERVDLDEESRYLSANTALTEDDVRRLYEEYSLKGRVSKREFLQEFKRTFPRCFLDSSFTLKKKDWLSFWVKRVSTAEPLTPTPSPFAYFIPATTITTDLFHSGSFIHISISLIYEVEHKS